MGRVHQHLKDFIEKHLNLFLIKSRIDAAMSQKSINNRTHCMGEQL